MSAAKRGELDVALALAEDVLARRVALGDRWQESIAAQTVAWIAWDAGQHDHALALARRALATSLAISADERILGDLGVVADLLLRAGRVADAARLAGTGERQRALTGVQARLTTRWVGELEIGPEYDAERAAGRELELRDAARLALSWLDELLTTEATTTTS